MKRAGWIALAVVSVLGAFIAGAWARETLPLQRAWQMGYVRGIEVCELKHRR